MKIKIKKYHLEIKKNINEKKKNKTKNFGDLSNSFHRKQNRLYYDNRYLSQMRTAPPVEKIDKEYFFMKKKIQEKIFVLNKASISGFVEKLFFLNFFFMKNIFF